MVTSRGHCLLQMTVSPLTIVNMDNTSSHTPGRDMYPDVFPELAPKFDLVDTLRKRIDAKKDQDDFLWGTIVDRLRTDWTYHSNGIEGSTLTRGQTHFFLSEGLTAQGKPFKDFLDAQNHAEAIDMLFDVVADKLPISESFIKEINALILRGVEFTPAKNARGQLVNKTATPGAYKQLPNHVQQPDGTVHFYVEPIHVHDEMEALAAWIISAMETMHPIHVAAVAHYNMVRIHPFDDGNGRGARILMNLILMHKGYFPAVVLLETKPDYLEALTQADKGNLVPFISFVADTVITTKQSVLEVLDRNPSSETKL
jgi:Fic family protein